jgi:hypothetical protein
MYHLTICLIPILFWYYDFYKKNIGIIIFVLIYDKLHTCPHTCSKFRQMTLYIKIYPLIFIHHVSESDTFPLETNLKETTER